MHNIPSEHNPNGYPNVTSFKDRHGKRRWRYRKGSTNIPLGADYGGPEFLSRLEQALEPTTVTAAQPKPKGKPKSRTTASQKNMEKMLKAALSCDFYPTSMTYHRDGSITISFIEDEKPTAEVRPQNRGWDI